LIFVLSLAALRCALLNAKAARALSAFADIWNIQSSRGRS
jgi:hypothetical protein